MGRKSNRNGRHKREYEKEEDRTQNEKKRRDSTKTKRTQ